MKLITRNVLQKYSTLELRALFQAAYIDLIKSDAKSSERRNALASLENIQRELANRDPF